MLLRELRERVHAGGYSIRKEYLVRLRPSAVPDRMVSFGTASCEQMQVE